MDVDIGLWLLLFFEDMAFEVDNYIAVVLRVMKVFVSTGRFKGFSVSFWDLLYLEYVSI